MVIQPRNDGDYTSNITDSDFVSNSTILARYKTDKIGINRLSSHANWHFQQVNWWVGNRLAKKILTVEA